MGACYSQRRLLRKVNGPPFKFLRPPADVFGMYRLGLLALGLVLALSADSAARALCSKRAGAVILRETCKKRETQVDLAALGALGPQGPEGPRGPAGTAAVIRDAAGKVVGGWSPNPSVGPSGVVLTLGGRVVFLQAGASGFHAAGFLYYESGDCSGMPLLPTIADALVDTATVSGTTAYVPSGATSLHDLASYAQFLSSADCSTAGGVFVAPDRCCFATGLSADSAPADAVDLGTLGFVPPFHAEMP